MPYIQLSERAPIDKALEPIMWFIADYGLSTGQLNYITTRLCLAYVKKHGLRYSAINDVIGALECIKAEFYRRTAGPYEEHKLIQNGDVV